MFEKIMLPLDGSKASEHAITTAIEVSKKFDASVVLVHVVEPARYATQIAGLDTPQSIEIALQQAQQADKSNISRSRAYMTRMRTHLSRRGVDVTTKVLIGPVGKALLKVVKDEGIDLVVMGTRGRSGLKRSVLGSVTDEIVRESAVPVLVVGPTK